MSRASPSRAAQFSATTSALRRPVVPGDRRATSARLRRGHPHPTPTAVPDPSRLRRRRRRAAVRHFLVDRARRAEQQAPRAIVIDRPRPRQTWEQVARAAPQSDRFAALGYPLLLSATTRRSRQAPRLEVTDREKRAWPQALGVLKGSRIVRAHDVKGTKDLQRSSSRARSRMSTKSPSTRRATTRSCSAKPCAPSPPLVSDADAGLPSRR